jgi:acyl-CoA synthetase (AMP-forming)/AMP-acid ligase II
VSSHNGPQSLAEAIERAAKNGEGRGFRFVKNDKWVDKFYDFGDVEAKTRQVAGALQDLGLRKGDRCALILPDNAAFVLTFLGALRAGVVPVPIYPPMGSGQLGGYLDNTRHIVRRSGARALITVPVIKGMLGKVQAACPDLETITTYASLEESSKAFAPVDVRGDDVAFLQFTSGSTARPKGVVLTHANLLANVRNIVDEGLRIDPKVDAALSWLPLYHDMGLIGFVLAPIVATIQTTFLTPLMFLFRPACWLQAMSRYNSGMTFGPNFSYALCVKRVRDKDLDGVDMSHWRVAGCGAEPIRAETLEAFANKYAKYGFRKEAFFPAYGLAESTLAVSFARGLPTDRVKASTLWSEGRAEPCEESDADALRIVSCGHSFERHEVGVFALDDDQGKRPLGEREVGELRLRGPSVSQGYFEEPELTRKAFADGWFRTGDLGYKSNGDTYICGRSKELLIVHGRNFYPQDIEWEASQIDGVRKGNVVVFGTSGAESQGEGVVLVFETGETEPASREKIVAAVRARIMEFTGLTVDDVVPVTPGVLPKTSSGKLQRTKTRDLYERGELTGRMSARDADRMGAAKEIARSQLAYLKLAVFGGRKRGEQ